MAGGYNVGQGKGGPEWYGGQFYNIVFCSSSFIQTSFVLRWMAKDIQNFTHSFPLRNTESTLLINVILTE
jgi:hypothetical protein